MSALPHALRELRPTLRLALPITAGNVGQILIGLTDCIMIGRVGAVPLAASAFAGALFVVAYLLGIGILTPVAVRAAEAHGAGRPREAGETLRHGLVIAAITSTLLAFVLTGLSLKLQLFGQPAPVAAAAQAYLVIIGWSLLPGLGFLAVKNYYEALHRPWTPLYWVLGGLGLNVFLNWVLIYGRLGAPALGLTGAGWASLLSRLAVFVGLWCSLQRDPALAPARPLRWLARLRGRELAAQFAQGWPVSLQLFFESSLFSVSAIFMGWLGTVALAAHQVALNCAGTTFMFPLGLSHALAVRLGHARGAGHGHLLRVIGFGGIGAGVTLMACFSVMFLVAGPLIASAFIRDPEVVKLAARLLIVAGVFQIFDGTQVTAMGALRGLADVRTPTVITFFGYWLCAAPAAWLLGFPLGHGALGVWSGMAVGLFLCALLLVARFVAQTRTPRV
ncbi:MAG TPA: MATE family efflux transporter [Opitutaceae bacterium]|nr:MATE family efflux transporter [Opitutaceae bacterium]